MVIEGRLPSGSAENATELAEAFVALLKKDAVFMDGIDKITIASAGNKATGLRRESTFRIECDFKNEKGFYE